MYPSLIIKAVCWILIYSLVKNTKPQSILICLTIKAASALLLTSEQMMRKSFFAVSTIDTRSVADRKTPPWMSDAHCILRFKGGQEELLTFPLNN